jgi:MFS family permease
VPLLPLIRDEFALNYTQAGWLTSAFLLAYGVSQLPGGWLADRISPRLLVTIGISGVSLAGLMAGLAPNYLLLAASLIMLGLLGGGYHPSSAPLVSASIEPQKRGRALGLHQIGGTASYFLAPLIAVGIASSFGWRGSFILTAIPAIFLGIVLYVMLGRLGFTRQSISNRKSPVQKETQEEMPGHRRRLISFITLSIVGKDLIVGVISFIPLFLVDHFGIDETRAGGLLFIVYLGGLWAGPLGGYLSDRLGNIRVMLVGSLIMGPFIYLLNLASFGWSIYAVMTLIGMSMYLLMPTSEAYIISHTPEHRRSTILGIYYFGSRGGPGIVAPVLGYLIDRLGFNHAFAIAGALILILTLICSIFLRGSRD